MSGIYGILSFDGAPISDGDGEAMRTAMRFWGPDGEVEWRGEGAMLGRMLAKQTPEDAYDVQPMVLGDQVMVASARLDNRHELVHALRIPDAEAAQLADAMLLARAHEKWGDTLVEHVVGDWTLAVWNNAKRELLLARDHFGFSSLYYHVDGTRLIFASSIKALLSLPGHHWRPDMIRVAQILTYWLGDGTRTAYEEIRQLPVAHMLRASKSTCETKRYWDPSQLTPLRAASDEEYIEEFLSTYEAAVRGSLRTNARVGATLSGGLDSGSVVALAAPLLRARGRELTAYTSVPLYDSVTGSGGTRMGDEWADAHATAELAGVATHHRVASESTSVLDGLRHYVDTQDSPGHAVGNYYWMHEIARRAREEGIGVLLSGQYGNASISYTGSGYLWSYIQRGDLSGLKQSLALSEPNYLLALKRQVIKPIVQYPRAWFEVNRPGAWADRMKISVIRPEMVQELQIPRLARESGTDKLFEPRLQFNNQLNFYTPGMGIAGAIWRAMGAQHGLSIRDPTSNVRLIEFCVRAPDHLFRRRGVHRWLIRKSMEGRMPEQVLNYKKKGIQAIDIAFRVARERDAWEEVLRSIESHPLAMQFVDVARMRAVLRSVTEKATQENTQEVISILSRGVGAGLFLQRF